MVGISSLLSSVLPVMGDVTGAGAEPVGLNVSNRTPINVCPIGVNLGEILRPYNEGSVTNGGYGLEIPSRYATLGNQTVASLIPTGDAPMLSPMFLGALGVGVIGLYFLMRRKG